MTLYVMHVAKRLVGRSSPNPPAKLPQVNDIESTTLREYLSTLDSNANVFFMDRIDNALTIKWNGQDIRKSDGLRAHIKAIVVPLLYRPDEIDSADYTDLSAKLGVSNAQELEEAIFYLLKDINTKAFIASRKP